MGLVFVADRILPGCQNIPISIYDMSENYPNGDAEAMSILSPKLLKQHGIGEVKPRYSKTLGGSYLSNGCIHCDALQGRFFEHKYAYDSQKAFETEAIYKKEWSSQSENYTHLWWFNES